MILVLPLLIFSILFLPYLGLVPYLDGNTEFVIAYNFYSGHYLSHWESYHPPLKLFISSVFFKLFGFSSYSDIGYIFGIIGIISIYVIALKLFDKRTAILSAVFLSLSGLYISTALFSLNDFLETVFILLAFAFYIKEKYISYAIAISLAVMSKESALLFPVVVLLVEIVRKKLRFENLIPFLIFGIWVLFLHMHGHELWNSWNFSNTNSKGIIFTILYNLATLSIFNVYAYENWLHLFVFNYNWTLWILAAIGIPKLKSIKNYHPVMILLFIIAYTLINLSLQTYTITRYILPILPFVYIFAAFTLTHMKFSYVAISITLIFILLSLFTSNDPISNKIWRKYTILDQPLYTQELDGYDGLTYNMQFLFLVKKRDKIIRTKDISSLINPLNIDKVTVALYGIKK